LSTASQGTLKNQGGPMNEDEAEEFEKHSDFEVILSLRKWDDSAKVADIEVTDNDYYKELARNILTGA
jgi:predicted HD phosphohydrolase